jgi:hypothetical protein
VNRRTHSSVARLFALTIVAATACGDGIGPVNDLARAQSRWRENGADTYTLALTRSCFCGEGALGLVTVSVRNGVVESRTYADESPVPASFQDAWPDVPGLFALIGDALRRDADISVTYHPLHGAPTEVAIDYERQMADDELFYSAAVSIPR